MQLTRREVLAGVATLLAAACNRTSDRPTAASTTPAPQAVPSSRGSAEVPPSTNPVGDGAPTSPAATAAPLLTESTAAVPGPPARFIAHGSRQVDLVALTFHGAGDPALALEVLDVLTSLQAPSTIFAVGSWVDENPHIARRFLEEGHELANHTYRHPSLGELDAQAISEEIDRCRTVLASLAGPRGLRWFRPSAMVVPTDLVLERAGLAGYPVVVGYDVDSLDFQDPGAPAIVANVAAGIRRGSIVSLHLGHPGTVAALPQLSRLLHDTGLRATTVSNLLAAG